MSMFQPQDRVRVVNAGPVEAIHNGCEGRVVAVFDVTERLGIGGILVKVLLDGKRKERPFFADELELVAPTTEQGTKND